jgi:5-methylcytosine-specific restriction protein A
MTRLYGRAWQMLSTAFLNEYPDCADCGAVATVVDHEQPHRNDPALFWDHANWTPRCKRCHDRKTAQRDGGFGNVRATR